MDHEIQGEYSFSDSDKGNVTLSLFDKYYLNIKQQKRKKSREFKFEIAILNPEPFHIQDRALRWLVPALLCALAGIYFGLTQLTSGEMDLTYTGGVVAVAAILAGIFFTLFRKKTTRKWILQTRTARYPLIEIPYQKNEGEAASKFVQLLQGAIRQNVAKKDYTHDTLFAGEMRMLRRLVKKELLNEKAYEKMKNNMLKNSGQ